ncbi:MAG: hypothetical protein P1V20_13265 [Verrucomicrobiales bacterium]|nr:hypothetical protein [Verrucomicrobiales bacterium]
MISRIVVAGTVAAAWRSSSFALSLSSAYRWFGHLNLNMTRYRSLLCREIRPPPEDDTSLTAVAVTLRMFSEVSKLKGEDMEPFAYFQSHFQTAIL